MTLTTPRAVIVGAIILAAAIVYHATGRRYELAGVADGMALRLDRRTGATAACVTQRLDNGMYVAPCTGMRQ